MANSTKTLPSMFQHLVDTGLVWRLQGHYGRVAEALVNDGRITPRGA